MITTPIPAGATLANAVAFACAAPSALMDQLAARGQFPIMTGYDLRDARVVVTISANGDWTVLLLKTRDGKPGACVIAAGDGALFAPRRGKK